MNRESEIRVGLPGALRPARIVLALLVIAVLLLGSVEPARPQAYAALALAARVNAPFATAQMNLSTPTIHGGGTLTVSGSGLMPNTSYQVGLTERGGTPMRVGSVAVLTDAGGRLYTRLTLAEGAPAETAGVGVELRGGVVAYAPLEIRAPLALTPTPASAKPGALVQIAVTGLEAGYLRVDLDGQTVLGPLAVIAGDYNGSFSVPRHSAGSAPGVKLIATNLVGQSVMGRRSVNFDMLAPDPAPQPVVSGLLVSPDPLMPGQAFTLSGRIWPLPAEWASAQQGLGPDVALVQSGLAVSLVDTVSAVKSPVKAQFVSLDAGGYFMVTGTAPSFEAGSSVSLNQHNHMEINFAGSLSGAASQTQFGGPLDLDLSIEAYEYGSGNILPGVKTTLTKISRMQTAPNFNQFSQHSKAQEIFCNLDQWIHQTLPGTGLAHYGGNGSGIPIDLHPVNQVLFGSDLYGKAPLVSYGVTGAGGLNSPAEASAGTFNPYKFAEDEAVTWTKYHAVADGRSIGYSGLGWVEGGLLVVYDKTVWYHHKATTYNSVNYGAGAYDENGVPLNSNTLSIPFIPIPPTALGPQMTFSIDNSIDLGANVIDTRTLQTFGGFIHLAPTDGTPVNLMGFPWQVRINFSWDPVSDGQLTNQVIFFLDGTQIGTSDVGGLVGTSLCGGIQNRPQAAADLLNYSIDIPYPHNLKPGIRILGLQFSTTKGDTFLREVALRSDGLPAWFLEGDKYSARAITYNTQTKAITFGGTQLDPNQHKYGAEPGQASGPIPNGGSTPIKNEVKADMLVAQVYYPVQSLYAESIYSGVTSSMSAPTVALSNKPTAPARDGAGSDTVNINETNIPLAYMAMPLYVVAFEDPFGGVIVNGTSGALMEGLATLDMLGYAGPGGTNLLLTPKAQINLQIWLNINILYGVLGQAKMALYPSFGLNLPVRFTVPKPPGQSTPVSIESPCFSYHGDVYFFFGFLCVPYIGCAVEHEGTQNIYDGTYPSPCPTAAAANSPAWMGPQVGRLMSPPAPAAPTPLLPVVPNQTHVELFTTGKGGVAALWKKDALHLQTSQYDPVNKVWTLPAEVDISRTNDTENAAPLSANRNLLMWITTGYATNAELQAASPAQGAASMYVKSQLLDGALTKLAGASEVNVTPPFSGDGQIDLDSCPETENGCLAGGRATAAWVRMKNSTAVDPINSGTKLYYATFNGATASWSTPAAIPQPAGASDSQAQVFYDKSGALKIYFIRDEDFAVTQKTADDRYLYQYVPGEPGVSKVSGIPGSLVEFSLASAPDGNLHIAFTRIDDANVGLMDNRHPLYAGKAQGGVFSPLRLMDKYNRAIYAEGPSLKFTGWGEPLLTYRAMGMSLNVDGFTDHYPVDSLGVAFRTGDMAQLSLKTNQAVQSPTYLTKDGAVNWGIDTALDLNTGEVLSTGVHTPALALDKALSAAQAGDIQQAPEPAQALLPGLDTGIVFTARSNQPQFAIESAAPVNPNFQAPGGVFVNLEIRNHGAAFAGSGENSLKIVATWDAPYGVGTIAGQTALDSLGAGDLTSIQLPLLLPVSPDRVHTLYVTLAPPSSVEESTLLDNTTTLKMGGIAAPQKLMGSVLKRNTHSVLLTWQKVNDARVGGYRIYRAPMAGPNAGVYSLVGAVTALEWYDSSVATGQSYRYMVVALGISGAESAPSQPVQADLAFEKIYLPSIDRK